MNYIRPQVLEIEAALMSAKPLLQVIVGPRQVGKSTAATQVIERSKWQAHFAAADSALPLGAEWVETHWQLARRKAETQQSNPTQPVILVLDEIQKIAGWSEAVKRLWDEEARNGFRVRPILLGSSALLLQQGLTESLAGRFLLHRFTHWSFPECRDAFGWNLDKWIYFGGYPGAAELAKDEALWKRYIADSLIEPVIAKDVLQLQTVQKPALLRNLFLFASAYPAQILSYNKMLGQLKDAGNTVTLAHYLRLLGTAFLLTGLEQFSKTRKKGSSPKFIFWNNALITGLGDQTFASARENPRLWGRLVENAVGAHLLNGLQESMWTVQYFRKGDAEVDFVVSNRSSVWALEVKSARPGRLSALDTFRKQVAKSKALLIGAEGIPLEEFFQHAPSELLS